MTVPGLKPVELVSVSLNGSTGSESSKALTGLVESIGGKVSDTAIFLMLL